MPISKNLLGLFPGQGSQKVGMGKALFDEFEIAREIFEKADKALGFSLSKICFEGPAEKLTQTEITQPAILTVSTICYRLTKAQHASSFELAGAAGHSLGEYSALVAAQALRFEDAVALVHKRGKYMQEAVPVGQGKMIAVLGMEVQAIEDALSTIKSGIVQIANINSPGQVVVAGQATAVDEFTAAIAGTKTIPLPVSAPFHCALMKPAEEKLTHDLKALSISRARFPIFANFTAKPVSEPEEIREALRLQVCGRVRWVECMENAIAAIAPEVAVEFGEGAVLSGMLKRINPKVVRASVNSAESIATFKV